MTVNLRAPRLERAFFETAYWLLVLFFFITSVLLSLRTEVIPVPVVILFFCVLAVLFYARFVEPFLVTVKKYRLALVKKPERWIRVAFLSDLHADGWKGKRFYDRVVRKTQAQKPDLILIGGDVVEETASHLSEAAGLAKLDAPMGKYFILGNHDFMDDAAAVRRQLEAWGYEDVTNRVKTVSADGRAFDLVGLDDSWFGDPDLPLVRGGHKRPRVVLSHEPDVLFDLRQGDADLILLGHTHGGQIRLPLIGHVAPLPQAAPQWLDLGKKTWKGMPVVISAGLGETNLNVRLFCPPQIVLLEIGI